MDERPGPLRSASDRVPDALQNLESLCGFASAHAAFEASLLRIVRPVLPRIVERGEVRRFEIRDDAGCASTFEEISLPAAR